MCVAAGVTSVSAQSSDELATIDIQLAEQLDFRALAFKDCLDKESCTVDGVTIAAFDRETEQDEWRPAEIYWDPVDGIGVSGGDQNDEIDFDERLTVTFDAERAVKSIWLSDMFIAETQRYGGISISGEDYEYARIEFVADGILVNETRISGFDRLPRDAFNSVISGLFAESGDLRRRTIVDERTLALVLPNFDYGRDVLIELPLDSLEGDNDAEKRAIFEGVPTVEIDVSDILAEFASAPIFAPGTYNANRMRERLESDTRLLQIKETAQSARVVSDVKNGEIAGEFDPAIGTTQLIFLAPFDTSNDYSVAGVIFE